MPVHNPLHHRLTPTPTGISAEHRFPRGELDPAEHRRALLALADGLGAGLRTSGQIAQGVTCTVRYADQSAANTTRQLTLDNGDDKPLAIEAVVDRARARFGHSAIHPASLAITTRTSQTGGQEDAHGRWASEGDG
jgi:DNA polymerase-4